MKKLAPIVLFVYNRPDHTKQTVEALKKNVLSKDSELFIYSDAAKNENDYLNVEKVRKYIKTISGFKNITIIEKEINWGLAKSIIDGVSEVISHFGKVIVLEDDMVTSPQFLEFLNDSLEMYSDNEEVGMIHGHIYNISDLPKLFFTYKAGCLGWGTWENRWKEISFNGKELLKEISDKKLEKKFDVNGSYPYVNMLKGQIEGKNNSWAIRLYASFLLNEKLTLYPGKSLVQHIGFDIGTHCKGAVCASDSDGFITTERVIAEKIDIVDSKIAILKLEQFYNAQKKSFIVRVINKLKKMLLN